MSGVNDELKRLTAEKEALEQRIRMLTSGVSIHEDVKLDIISTKGPQLHTWAVSFKYRHERWNGKTRSYWPSERWVPIVTCADREEAIKAIPKAIKALQDLYDEVTGKRAAPAATGNGPGPNNP